ncbi:MAG: pentapeptide repeat-containing protein, partial [Nitrococcus sp.]|nr:pentapeptide repeat-containing protein [Nitrococcus sp.]
LQRANMYKAQMQGATLYQAEMQGANMSEAKMQGADMNHAQMQAAKMKDANLRHVQMQGAHLGEAQMQGADLRHAQMQDSNCEGAMVLGALVQSTDLTCRDGTLTQRQLQFTVGDAETVLPGRLHVWSCLERAALAPEVLSQIKAAMEHYPEKSNGRISRAEFKDLLFCNQASENPLRRSPHEVGRHPELESAAAV